MSKQRKIGEVFLDELTGRRLKCVEDDSDEGCDGCVFDRTRLCSEMICVDEERNDNKSAKFIQTDEPLTTE
jgi:RNase P/RNase MRP subunit p29